MARGIVAMLGRDVTFRQTSGYLVCNACGEKVKQGRTGAHLRGKHRLRQLAAISLASLATLKEATKLRQEVSCPDCGAVTARFDLGKNKCRACGYEFYVPADGKGATALKINFMDRWGDVKCPFCNFSNIQKQGADWIMGGVRGLKRCGRCQGLFWGEEE